MADMAERLRTDPDLAAAYARAHESYLADRDQLAQQLGVDVPEIAGVSAGGMPERVKCLHALAGHSLAKGSGVNPLGDEALAQIGEFWHHPCLETTRQQSSVISRDPASPLRSAQDDRNESTAPVILPKAGPPAADYGPNPNKTAKVAIIDCGTNTVRLLIADATASSLTTARRELRYARLGEGVDANGRFTTEALTRTFAAVEEYAQIITEANVDKVRFVATSAARDVSNREEFFEGIYSRLGIYPDVIAGTEEAELSFLGALSGGPLPSGDVLVVDIGGGSTELIRGTNSGQVSRQVSLDIGAVRVRERFLHSDPPTADEIQAARTYISNLLASDGVPLEGITSYIGVAGTATSLAAMRLGLSVYDPTQVHNAIVDTTTIETLSTHLLTSTITQIISEYPYMHPMRAEVICAGALICSEISRRATVPMIVRETDILDGAALKLMRV